MADPENSTQEQLPSLADLKAIACDLFMEIGSLQEKLRDAQRKLRIVTHNIAKQKGDKNG